MTSSSNLLTYLRTRSASTEGATMVEYGLMLALIAIIALVAVQGLGVNVTGIFTESCTEIGGAGDCG